MTPGNEAPRGKRDVWEITRTIFTILTPLILGIGGFFVNQNISEIRNRVEKVERMIPLLDRMAENHPTRPRLAANGFYVLMKEDPRLVVRVILSTRNKELEELLRDIAMNDPEIAKALKELIAQREGRAALDVVKTPEEMSAARIIETFEQPNTGWFYIGKKFGDQWTDLTLELGDSEPAQDTEYLVSQNTYLRKTEPKLPEYRLGEMIGVVKEGSKVKVLETRVIQSDQLENIHDPLDRIWARVLIDPASLRARPSVAIPK